MPPPVHVLKVTPDQLRHFAAQVRRDSRRYGAIERRCLELGMTHDDPLLCIARQLHDATLHAAAALARMERCADRADERGVDGIYVPPSPRVVGSIPFNGSPVYEWESEAGTPTSDAVPGWPYPGDG